MVRFWQIENCLCPLAVIELYIKFIYIYIKFTLYKILQLESKQPINLNTSNSLDTCAGKNCSNNGKCVAMQGKDSKCKCPKLADCSRKIELVCGKTDQETYINHCAQKVHSCRKQRPSGVLEEDYCCKFVFVPEMLMPTMQSA